MLIHTVEHPQPNQATKSTAAPVARCDHVPMTSKRSIMMQRQAALSQIIHIRHNNKAVLTPHATSKGQLFSVLGIVKPLVRCIAITDALQKTTRYTLTTHRRQSNDRIQQRRIATDRIRHISTALAIFPGEIKA
ncbi:hypothetical protein ABBQ32_010486 [Trebouxia sp. C0010 RCD-2024]